MPCTKVILEATKEYFEENPQSHVQKVYFLSIDMKVCQGFEAGMETVFNIDHSAKDVMLDESDSDHDFIDLTETDDMPTSSNPGLKINNDVITTKEGFDIRLIKGKIEDSKVDVIVNTTSGDLNLNSGNVSKALLRAAGRQLQQECDAAKANTGKIPLKGFVGTGPAALKCQKVFHTSSTNYIGQESIQVCF
ncbi:protein mono-ADP-ribosyltransferase PARP14-like [Anneissia japonica]|uniref:protein mono-ADP-ribosyltransferase PARP14-like n=1 Tax=Anneissia japonica TaxID=1529436 RepID=UPI00142569B5|nr:protein mono-ADP-ribosyltransferase PARP14-like [Anneissia japonica]